MAGRRTLIASSNQHPNEDGEQGDADAGHSDPRVELEFRVSLHPVIQPPEEDGQTEAKPLFFQSLD